MFFHVNKDRAVIIITGLDEPIICGMSEDMSMSGSNDWQTPEGSSQMGKVNQLLNAGKNLANRFGAGMAQTSTRNIAGTVVAWQGSGNKPLTLPLLFVATAPGDNVLKPWTVIEQACAPDISGPKNLMSLVKAPNGFTGGNAEKPEGCVGVKIGVPGSEIFKSPKLFVISNYSFNYSKELMEDTKKPLWSRGSVELKAFRMLGADEIAKMYPS